MKYLFTIMNTIMVAVIAYFCVDIMYKDIILKNFIFADKHDQSTISKNINPVKAKSIFNKNRYNNIIKRNIFKVEVTENNSSDNHTTENSDHENLETTNLKLLLWGTVVGASNVYAVIEDKTIHHQSLYEVGDSIQDAEIKKILRHKVILTYQGEDQVLKMQTDNKKLPKSAISARKTPLNKTHIRKSLIDTFPGDINTLIKQVKFRPHFKGGRSDGLMLYGIKPGSEFRKVGFKNGDILKEFNGVAITSTEDIIRNFPAINEADKATVTLSRRGKLTELVFQTDKDGGLLKSKGDE